MDSPRSVPCIVPCVECKNAPMRCSCSHGSSSNAVQTRVTTQDKVFKKHFMTFCACPLCMHATQMQAIGCMRTHTRRSGTACCPPSQPGSALAVHWCHQKSPPCSSALPPACMAPLVTTCCLLEASLHCRSLPYRFCTLCHTLNEGPTEGGYADGKARTCWDQKERSRSVPVTRT